MKSPPPIYFLSLALSDSAPLHHHRTFLKAFCCCVDTQPVLCHTQKENLPDLPKTCFVLGRFSLCLPFFSHFTSQQKTLAILSFAFFHQVLLLHFTFLLILFLLLFPPLLLLSLLLNSPPFHWFCEGSWVLSLAAFGYLGPHLGCFGCFSFLFFLQPVPFIFPLSQVHQ